MRPYQKKPDRSPALQLLFQQPGSLTKLANQLGVRKQTLSHWREVPSEYLVRIEKLTGVPRQQLRPDLYSGMATSSST